MSLNLVDGCQDYIKTMIERVNGMKVLVMDAETVAMVSLLYTQTQILEREVFLVEKIDNKLTEKQRHLKAVYFVRPTRENIELLKRELKNPHFGEYHLFFSNTVAPNVLEDLAKADSLELVQQVHEYFCDVYVVNRDLFSLNMPSTSTLALENGYTAFEEQCLRRTVDGLFSVCLSLQRLPVIRYLKNSHICQRIAISLHARFQAERSLFDQCRSGGAGEGGVRPILLLADRREDPLTPLLNQWTYQAMIHELFGATRNRVSLKGQDVAPELQDLVMSTQQDDFLKDHQYAVYGEMPGEIMRFVNYAEDKKKSLGQGEDLENLQKLVDAYPEFKRLQQTVQKHYAVVQSVTSLISSRNLLEVSSLEQDMAVSERRNNHLEKVLELLRSPADKAPVYEKLRVALVFALRYESDPKLSLIKQELANQIGQEKASLMDALLAYAGNNQRSSPGELLGQDGSLLNAGKSLLMKNMAQLNGVTNIYTQHKSLLSEWVAQLLKGRLRESLFPFAGAASSSVAAGLAKERVNECIVYVAGGATFAEARDLAALSGAAGNDFGGEVATPAGMGATGEGCRVVLGGSDILNSSLFLADLDAWSKRTRQSNKAQEGIIGRQEYAPVPMGGNDGF